MTKTDSSANYANATGLRAAAAIDGGEDVGQFRFWRTLLSLSQVTNPRTLMSETVDLCAELVKIAIGVSDVKPDARDWRFRDDEWQDNDIYRRLGQGYLAFCKSANAVINDDVDWRTRERARFAVEVLTSTLAPTNTLLGNPAALRKAWDTRGRSLADGLGNLLADIRNNGGMPSMVDASPFTKGENIAATPGAVVYRSDVLELIQYRPSTGKVRPVPMLLIPPQINKYYFTDLAPGRSLAEYAVGQGIQTFTVSWRNPDVSRGDWTLDTYVNALLDAIDAMRDITGSDKVNATGFCAGGITLAALLAYLAATGDARVNAAAFAVTLLDWGTPATVGMLHSDTLIELTKKRSRCKGIVSGRDLGVVFAWFRPNELIWNYWVNNYLMGNKPPSFDILAWNADTTDLPAELHAQFLDIFHNNSLIDDQGFEILGKTVHLRDITIDTYVMGARNDHLTPWDGCYRSTQLFGGSSTFVLSNAGHIASLVNPPGNPKASYKSGPPAETDCEAWAQAAEEKQGSWWEHWQAWAQHRAGKKVEAPSDVGSAAHPPLEAAPGTYING